MWVDPASRRLGVGKRVLETLEALAIENGVKISHPGSPLPDAPHQLPRIPVMRSSPFADAHFHPFRGGVFFFGHVLVRSPGSEREACEHLRSQRRLHQLLGDDQLLNLGCGFGARVLKHGKEPRRVRERTAIAKQRGVHQICLVAGFRGQAQAFADHLADYD